MEEDGAKKKNPSQFGGIVRGARLTCKKNSLEIFRTVVVVARFDPSLYPQIVIFIYFFFILFYLSRFTTYQKESRKSFAYPKYISLYLDTAVFVIAQYLTIVTREWISILIEVRRK